MTGESIDLRISLKTVVSGQIYSEIFSAKPLVNSFLKKKSSAIRKGIINTIYWF